ncbi:hypothetical protein CDD80_4250 [Ophiocordyceps camponoti-rufipedis]|uniref:Large ribosomal subunit protein mL49 n=1 Tax=Ophiocordyceps camponoti-rufipedis TaxID=2004952 RepID=A0A2C5YYI6_9HYPO|nr:hypothetical protein CDD80_4250 [Ophiocordyceps camponoti-rufipedis]
MNRLFTPRIFAPRLFRAFVSTTPSPSVRTGSVPPLTAVEQKPEAPAGASIEAAIKAPAEATTEAPAKFSVGVLSGASIEALAEAPAEETTEAPAKFSVGAPSGASIEALAIAPAEATTEAPAKFSVGAPSGASIEALAEALAEAQPSIQTEASPSTSPNQPEDLPIVIIPADGPDPSELPYHIRRSKSLQLPIYIVNRQITRIKGVTGDLVKLRDAVIKDLCINPGHVWINPTTKHLNIKGDVTKTMKTYLIKQGF